MLHLVEANWELNKGDFRDAIWWRHYLLLQNFPSYCIPIVIVEIAFNGISFNAIAKYGHSHSYAHTKGVIWQYPYNI